jgi:predicted nucleic acid-binding protein
MKERVYVETSVIGAYFDERTDIVSSAQRYWTRLWWDEARSRYEAVISRAVMDELSHQDFPHSGEALGLVSDIREVPVVEEVRQVVRSYIQNRIMPANPVGDALHLALASYHKCDYLLTWNCRHIANPNKFRQIRMCNISMGLYVPFLVTPNQLIGGYNDR